MGGGGGGGARIPIKDCQEKREHPKTPSATPRLLDGCAGVVATLSLALGCLSSRAETEIALGGAGF